MNIHTIVYKTLLAFGIKKNRMIIPMIPEKELLPTIDVNPLEKGQEDGNISTKELAIISQLVKNRRPKAILEIGTFDGRTTLNLANFSPDGAQVYTLDLPKKDMGQAKFAIEAGDGKYVNKETIGGRYGKNDGKITQLYGDSAMFDFSPFYGKIDFVFVDGSHSAPYAKNDSEVALRIIRPGGVILWHDYGVWKGVTKVLNAYYANDPRFKAIRHIDGTSFVIVKA
jgi:predicted O-methyltransferase YrrM